MLNLLIKLLSSSVAGIMYRLGGKAGFDTKFRDWGCPVINLGTIYLITGTISWWYALSFFLLWWAYSTYWKQLNKFFGKPKDDCFWFNWAAHGLGIALATIPLLGLTWRLLLLPVLITLWALNDWIYKSWKVGKLEQDDWGEWGRGVIANITL